MGEVRPISKRELLDYRAEVKNEIFRQIRKMFHRLKQTGFTQKDLATKLGVDEGLLSRRMRGENDMRLETFSDLARGLDCRIDVRLTPLSEVVALNKLQLSSDAIRQWLVREAVIPDANQEAKGRALAAWQEGVGRSQLEPQNPSSNLRNARLELGQQAMESRP
jgi:transcriptional regulator with XRE-family HTH domain